MLKDLKQEFCCNGTVVQDPELDQVCIPVLDKLLFINLCNELIQVVVLEIFWIHQLPHNASDNYLIFQ